jgi:tetratricopeptide (TPR) repeat protein
MNEPSPSRPTRKLPWYRKLIYGLLPTICLLVGAEFLLAIIGVRPVSDRRDPYVGFSSRFPLFQEVPSENGQSIMSTVPSKLVWFNQQSFAKRKAAGVKRIFCVGGSTTFGRPFADSTSYAGWMRELLPLVDATCKWEVINAGGVSYASYRVATLMEELANYEPDLFVVYSAHNEFLERRTYAGMFEQPAWALGLQSVVARTRVFALVDRISGTSSSLANSADILPAEVDERLNHTVGPADYERDPVWQRKVIAHYRLNLQRMVRIAEDAGARIVFVSPASNEKDCSPFKSQATAGLPPEDESRFAKLMSDAAAEVNALQFGAAADLYREAVTVDAMFAESEYGLGKALYELQDFEAALTAFERARENDVCPLRALESLSEAVRQVASQNNVPLIDFERLLRAACRQQLGHECLGDEYFLDHVHPTIEVHRQLAMWIINGLQQSGFVSAEYQLDDQSLAVHEVVRRVNASLDTQANGVALRNLAKVLHWSGKFAEAAPRARDALELLPRDPESRFVLADCLKNMGDTEGALGQYELLMAEHADYGRAYLPYGELLASTQALEPAKAYLMLAILREPDNAYAHAVLGRVHMTLDENRFALESLEKANALGSSDLSTEQMLEEVRRRLR